MVQVEGQLGQTGVVEVEDVGSVGGFMVGYAEKVVDIEGGKLW